MIKKAARAVLHCSCGAACTAASQPAEPAPTWSRDVFAAGPQRLGGGVEAVAQALRGLLAHLQIRGQAGGGQGDASMAVRLASRGTSMAATRPFPHNRWGARPSNTHNTSNMYCTCAHSYPPGPGRLQSGAAPGWFAPQAHPPSSPAAPLPCTQPPAQQAAKQDGQSAPSLTSRNSKSLNSAALGCSSISPCGANQLPAAAGGQTHLLRRLAVLLHQLANMLVPACPVIVAAILIVSAMATTPHQPY